MRSAFTTYANVSWRSMLHCHWTDSGSITPNLTVWGLDHWLNVFVLKRPVHCVIFECVYILSVAFWIYVFWYHDSLRGAHVLKQCEMTLIVSVLSVHEWKRDSHDEEWHLLHPLFKCQLLFFFFNIQKYWIVSHGDKTLK